MEVFLLKVDGVWKGQRFGPYSPDQVKSSFAAGDFTKADLAFFDGCDGWVPITQVPGVSSEEEENSDDPEVDLERQRELAEMFPDPEDDLFDDDDEEEETESAPVPPTDSTDSPTPLAEPQQTATPPQPEPKPAQTPSPEKAPPATTESPEKSMADGGGGHGRRFSLSKAQSAIRRHKGDRRKKRRGVVPMPPRPGMVAFGWIIVLTLLFGIGVSMMPEAGVKRSSSGFSQIFGQLHPILVHLPVGALLLAFPMHMCDCPGIYRHVGIGSVFVLWFAVLGSVLSVFTGYFQSFAGVSDAEILAEHVTLGVLVGAGACGSLFLKLISRRFKEAWLHHLCSVVLFATVLALLYSVHLGASLTHGKYYLNGTDAIESPEDSIQPEPGGVEEPSTNSTVPEAIKANPFKG